MAPCGTVSAGACAPKYRSSPAKVEAELAGTGFNAGAITTVYEDDASYTDGENNTFHKIKSFTNTENEGSGYDTIPSITIASSGSVISFIQPDLKLLANTGITHYVEEPTTGTY